MNELPEVVRAEIDDFCGVYRVRRNEVERIALLALQQGREQGLEDAARELERIYTGSDRPQDRVRSLKLGAKP